MKKPLLDQDPESSHNMGVSNYELGQLLFKAIVGSGIIFLPRAFVDAGLVAGVLMLSISLYLTMLTNELVVQAQVSVQTKRHDSISGNSGGSSSSDSLATMAGLSLGKAGQVFVKVGTMLVHLGYSTTYIVFTWSNAKLFVDFIFPSLLWINPNFYIAGFGLLYVTLVLIRDVARVARLAGLGNYLILGTLLYLSIVCGIHIYNGEIVTTWSCPSSSSIGDKTSACAVVDWHRFPGFFGNAIFAYYSSTMILPLKERMANKSDFLVVERWVFLLVTSVSMVVCVLPMLAYGESLKAVVFESLDSVLVVQLITLSYCLVLTLSLLPILFAPIDIIEDFNALDHAAWSWKHVCIRVGVLSVSMLIGVVCGINNLPSLVNLVGSLFCGPLQFIIPPIIHLKLVDGLTIRQRCVDFALIGFGTVSSIASIMLLVQT